MHYTISMKVLGQTHMWYTQHKRSKFLDIFQFLWAVEFLNILKNRTSKVRSTKKSTKQNLWKKHAINWKQCMTWCMNLWPKTSEVLIQGHRRKSCISTLLHPHFTSVLGESLRWRGTTNITFKRWSEASKAQWYVL